MLVEKIGIDAIPDYLFDGYYWYSDADKPTVVTGEKIDKAKFTKLPFIVEGNFYAAKERLSIKVQCMEGVYTVYRFNLAELKDEHKYQQLYLGHDIGGLNFEMIEAWQEMVDPLLEGMASLQPAWSAFAGFTQKTP